MMESPLNGSRNIKKIKEISTKVIAENWDRVLGIDVGEEFKSLGIVEHWRCNSTSFEWYEPESCAGNYALYSQLQKFGWYYMPDKWEFKVALKLFPENSTILEIGAGFGHFLTLAKRHGIDGVGVEINHIAAAAVRQAGFKVYEDGVEVLAERLGPIFDGVCAFQVLEHIVKPIPFLNGMIGLLRPGGKIVLSVPNDSLLKIIDPEQDDLLDQPPHHVSFWSENVFSELEKLLPVKILFVESEPLQSYHVEWFVFSIGKRVRNYRKGMLGCLLVNKLSLSLARLFLHLGFRKLVPGQTLLVALEKNS